MHRVTACKAEDDYKLWIRFDDGLEGSVFLGNLLEIGAFKLWRDVREFEKVSVDPESATVTWEGGIRLDPEILYQDLLARTNDELRQSSAVDAMPHRIQPVGSEQSGPAVG